MEEQDNFLTRRRQQFLDENTYQVHLPFYEKSIERWKTETASPVEPNDDGVYSARYTGLSRSMQYATFLYTSGAGCEEILQPLTTAIEFLEECHRLNPEARRLKLLYHPVYEIYEPEDLFELTQLAALAVLFNRPDLTVRVNACIEQTEIFKDAVYGYVISGRSVGTTTVDTQHQKRYQELIDAIHADSPEAALKAMNAYLKAWYKKHKGYGWIGSHERYSEDEETGLEGNFSYDGYWSFEAAAVVVHLGLDDTTLHQYIWYPKDMVAHARSLREQAKMAAQPTILYGRPGERVPHTGKWVVDNFVGFENWLEKDDIFPQGRVSGMAEATFRDDAVFRFTLDGPAPVTFPEPPPARTPIPYEEFDENVYLADMPPELLLDHGSVEPPVKPEHPYKGKRFTSGENCPCNGVWQVVDGEKASLVWANPAQRELAESRYIRQGEPFPERMIRHTKPREVEVKSGLFSKKTVQEFDYLDQVHWILSPKEIDDYRG